MSDFGHFAYDFGSAFAVNRSATSVSHCVLCGLDSMSYSNWTEIK